MYIITLKDHVILISIRVCTLVNSTIVLEGSGFLNRDVFLEIVFGVKQMF